MLGIWAETFMTAARADRGRAARFASGHVATPDEAPAKTRPLVAVRRGPHGRRGAPAQARSER
jgi:hypothetical protein